MARFNVHDLAKELNREESDIISLCVSKGMSGVTRATMLPDNIAAEVRNAFPKQQQESEEDKQASKKKLRVVFHPEHSKNVLSQKKKPQTAAKADAAESNEAEAVSEEPVSNVQENAPEKEVKPQQMQEEQKPAEARQRNAGYARRDQNGSYNAQKREGQYTARKDGQYSNAQNGPRREGSYNNGSRSYGMNNQNGQRRDQAGNGQRREGGQYNNRRSFDQNSSAQGDTRRDPNSRGFQRRDSQGTGFNRYNGNNGAQGGQTSQRPYGQGQTSQRPYGQGGARGPQRSNDGFKKDQGFQKDFQKDYQQDNRRGGQRDRQKPDRENLESLNPALTKNEARGGKAINKKERELREKERQSVEKTNRFEENTKNISKMKQVNKKPEENAKKEEDDGIKTIIIPETLTLTELAEKMKLAPAALVKALFLKGTMLTINAEISFEQAEEIALDFNFICEKEKKVDVIEELLKEEDDPEETKTPRPPVVCVMGHVDHGKTSLLDAVRSTHVIDREAGGITQHIGAYTVKCNDQDITFLDTPGHEAFTAMRMRGAQATDIAVLVVAADDGVMPQTVEAINHAKAAGVEIIVAVNKIDKPNANIERVKQELSEYELIPEDWGGKTIFVPVSAKTHEGIDTLLEMILLVAEVKELKANPNRAARGLVIEAQLDKGRGPVATILVQKGTLHVGDNVAAGSCFGKVRAMIDDKGRRVKEAYPSTPVEILGLNDVPNAGEIFVCTSNEKEARAFADTFIEQNREKLLADTKTKLTLDSLNSQIHEGNLKELNIIVKADVQGSVEALKQSFVKLSNDEVVVKIIHSGVGAINESDVNLASASNAIIIGFNIRPDVMAKSIADREKVEIRLYRVIYQAIEEIESAMKGMLDPVYEEKVIGHAVVRQIFKASGVGNIAGSYITDGMFQRGCKIRITRGSEQVYEGALASLKRFKDDVKEVKEGYECGLVFEKFNEIQIEDTVEAYIMQEVPR